MKKATLLMLGSFMLLSLLLVACGDKDEVENPPENANDGQEQQTDNNNTDVDDNAATDDGTDTDTPNNTSANTDTSYGFKKFELDADYPDANDALDVDFENETNENMEASYRDQSQGIDLNGDEAIKELDPIFSGFDFDENTPDDEVLDAVIKAFNIPEEATDIELEIDFSNGTEKEYRR